MEENRDKEMSVDELLEKLKNDLLGTDADAHIAEPEQEDAELAQVADAGTEEVPKAVLEEPVRAA